jgi:hypothetical protein
VRLGESLDMGDDWENEDEKAIGSGNENESGSGSWSGSRHKYPAGCENKIRVLKTRKRNWSARTRATSGLGSPGLVFERVARTCTRKISIPHTPAKDDLPRIEHHHALRAFPPHACEDPGRGSGGEEEWRHDVDRKMRAVSEWVEDEDAFECLESGGW